MFQTRFILKGLILIFTKLSHGVLVGKFDIEADCVNRYFIFTGLILFDTCQKALWEEEPVHPEDLGRAGFEPVVDKLASVFEFLDPEVQCLHTQEALPAVCPVHRHLVVKQVVVHLVQLIICHQISFQHIDHIF